MLENLVHFFKKHNVKEIEGEVKPINKDKNKDQAKERLHLVLMQDRANVSADFLDMMKQEIVDVIKKYIDVDETDMDVKLENRINNDGTSGAPALYANIPIVGINEEKKKESEEIRKSKETEEENTKAVKKTRATKKTVSAKKSTTKTTKTTKKTATKRAKKEKTDDDTDKKEEKSTKKATTKKNAAVEE